MAKDVAGHRAGRQDRRQRRQPVRRLDDDLAGHDAAPSPRGTTVRAGAGGRRCRARLLRAGRVGDRQRRHRGHRRHRRDAVLRRVRRHPDAGGRHLVREPAHARCPSTPPTSQVVQRMKQAGLKTVRGAGGGPADDHRRDRRLARTRSSSRGCPAPRAPASPTSCSATSNPTGKLPHTWPRSMAQIPINQGDATYDPLFPYAYGMTY